MDIDNINTFACQADLLKFCCQKEGKEFQKYYDEGRGCFHSNLDKWRSDHNLNPYIKNTGTRDYSQTGPARIWRLGFCDAVRAFFFGKYNLNDMNKELLAIADKYGIGIEFDDEYGLPEGKTPEGFTFGLFDNPK